MKRATHISGLALGLGLALGPLCVHAGQSNAGGGGAVSQTEPLDVTPGPAMAIVRLAANRPDRSSLYVQTLTNNNRVLLSKADFNYPRYANTFSSYRWQLGNVTALTSPDSLISALPFYNGGNAYKVSDMNESGTVIGWVQYNRTLPDFKDIASQLETYWTRTSQGVIWPADSEQPSLLSINPKKAALNYSSPDEPITSQSWAQSISDAGIIYGSFYKINCRWQVIDDGIVWNSPPEAPGRLGTGSGWYDGLGRYTSASIAVSRGGGIITSSYQHGGYAYYDDPKVNYGEPWGDRYITAGGATFHTEHEIWEGFSYSDSVYPEISPHLANQTGRYVGAKEAAPGRYGGSKIYKTT